ncbi:hypothetical protein SOCEGT47_049900 [Sorangium cellulosum]|uniref:MalT-like TPR region domain-containing protein n=2 Tax=Sorangium cellulosum TaxID=56 RepID=A0A4V0NE01_SORCE|nr:hypothetical protein SOCEGT47_049900 [Sorangium cellulosum]
MSRSRPTPGSEKTAEIRDSSVLPVPAALAFLAQNAWGTDTPPATDAPWAYALIAALGHLPPAIEIAAATLRRTGMSAEAYLRKHAARLASGGSEEEIVAVVLAEALDAAGEEARGVARALAVLPAANVPLEVIAAAAGKPAPSTARPLQSLVHGRLVTFQKGALAYLLNPVVRAAIRRDVVGDAALWDALHRSAADAMQALLFWTAAVEGRPEAAMRRRVASELFAALDTAPFQEGARGAEVLARALVDACTVLDLGLTIEVQERLLEGAARLAGEALPALRARALAALEAARRPTSEPAGRRRGTFGTLRATPAARERGRPGHRDLLRKALRASAQRGAARYAPPVEDDGLRAAKEHLSRGCLRLHEGALDAAAAAYGDALAALEAAGDVRGQAIALLLRGELRRRQGDLAAASRDHERALPLFRAAADRAGEAMGLLARGSLRLDERDAAGAAADYDCALMLLRACRDRIGEANVLKARGDLCFMQDDLAGAARDYDRALYILEGVEERVLSQLRFPPGVREERRGAIARARAAREHLPQQALLRALGYEQTHARTWQARGDLRLRERQAALAARDYGNAILLYRESGDRRGEAAALKARGDLRRQRGALPGAQRDYDDALRLFEALADGPGQAAVLKARADLRCERGDTAGAALDYTRALALFDATGDGASQTSIRTVLAGISPRPDDPPRPVRAAVPR